MALSSDLGRPAADVFAFRYVDKLMTTDIAFALAPSGAGTHLVQTMKLEMRSWTKLLTSMIRSMTSKQVAGDAEPLKALFA